MAGTSYRGLTIRIGGDVTKLTKALSSANKAITATQGQLRRLNQAARLDPGRDLLSDKLVIIRNKAEEVATRLATLQTAMNQLGSTQIGIRSVADLAETTKDAALEAERAREEFNKVDQELEVLYRKFFDMSGTQTKQMFSDEEINTYVESLKKLGGQTKEDAERFFELKDAWGRVAGELETADMVAKFVDLQNETMRATVEAEALGREFAELKLAAAVPEEIKQLDAEMDQLAASSNIASGYMQELDRALELDPSNVTAAEQKMELLEAKTQLTASQLEVANKKLDAFSDDVRGLAGGNGIVELAEGASKAKDAFAKQEGVVKLLKGSLNEARREADNLAKEGKENTTEYQRAAAKISDLEHALSAAEQEAERLGEEAARYQGAVQYREAAIQAENLAGELKQAQSAQEAFRDRSKLSSQDYLDMAQAVSNVLVPALKRLAEYSIDAANQVDGAFRNMKKTVNATEEQYEALRDAAQEFSTTHFTSADEMLNIMAMGGQLGIAAENLESFSETVSQIGIATNIETQDAAQNLGQLINIMSDLDEGNVDNFADSLVRLGNNMPALESDIMNITTRIASQSDIIGLTTPQVLAWSTAIASTGQKSEAAGTAIAKTMTQIESAVASGGEELETFAEVAGMTASQFAETWESDPNTALREFIAGLVAIDDSGDSMILKLEELGITGVRQKQTIEGLAQTLDVLDDAIQMSQDAWDGVSDEWGDAGDAAREADRKAEGFSGTLQELKNSAQVLGAEIGESLTPYLAAARDAVKGVYEWFSAMPAEAQTAIVTFGAIAGAIAPATVAVLSFKAAVDEGTGWQSKLAGMASKALNVVGVQNVAAGGALGIALAAVAWAAHDAYEMERKFNRVTQDLPGIIERVTGKLGSASTAFDTLAGSTENAFVGYRDYLDLMAEHVDTIEQNVGAYEDYSNKLELAQDYLNQYANQANLSTDEQGKLEWAVHTLNEELGLELELVDQVNGKIQDQEGHYQNNLDKINELIDARRREAKMAMYTETYTTLLQMQAEAMDQVAQAQETLSSFEGVEGAFGFTSLGQEAAQAQLDTAQAQLDTVNEQIQALEQEMADLGSVAEGGMTRFQEWTHYAEHLWGDAIDLSPLAEQFEELGVSIEDLNSLSSRQIEDLVDRWSTGEESLRDILDDLGVAYKNHADDAEGAMLAAGGSTQVYRSALSKLPGQVETETRKVKKKLEDNLNQERNASTWAARTMSAYKSSLNTNIDVSGVRSKLKQLDMSGQSYTWGTHLIDNLAAGIEARLNKLSGASARAAKRISNVLGQTVAKEGPLHYTDVWGVHLMDNIINGMESRNTALERASRASAEIIADSMDVESRLAVPTMADAPVTSLQGVVQGGNTVYIDGARINDTPAIRMATKDYLVELMRKGAM